MEGLFVKKRVLSCNRKSSILVDQSIPWPLPAFLPIRSGGLLSLRFPGG